MLFPVGVGVKVKELRVLRGSHSFISLRYDKAERLFYFLIKGKNESIRKIFKEEISFTHVLGMKGRKIVL